MTLPAEVGDIFLPRYKLFCIISNCYSHYSLLLSYFIFIFDINIFIPSTHDYNTYDMHKKMRQAVMFALPSASQNYSPRRP